ncbi:MAG: 3-dehydroquinate synthase family protein [Verrucomicrobiota bacterium]
MKKKSPKTLFVITVHSENYRNNLFYDEVRRGINIEANIQDINVEFLFGFQHSLIAFSDAMGIIFAPDGSAANKNLIAQIKKKRRIPIVQIDCQVLDEQKAPYFDSFVGMDNVHGGAATAEHLKSFLPFGSKALMIAGNEKLRFLSHHLRLDGFQKEARGHFEIAGIIYGNFDHHLVYKKLHDYFACKNSVPDAIFAFNDDSAIVAGKVLRELKIKKKILIAGFDGSAAGRAALSQGQIVCSYDQDPENLGRKALQIFNHLRQGEKTSRIHLLRGSLLTRKNIGNTFCAGVANFLDRAMTPLSFRKRKYEFHEADFRIRKSVEKFRNELICPIFFGDKTQLPHFLRQIDADKFIVISDNGNFLSKERERITALLKSKGLKTENIGFSQGEKNKTPKTLLRLIENILRNKITKKSCLVLLGGGITGNVGGLAASLLYRGIRFVHVPTTLMHMVDSSTGGKQAVDTKYGKNTVGGIWEPEFIFLDHRYISALPEREIRSGLAECVKHALCQDTNFLEWILKNNRALLKGSPSACAHLMDQTIRLKLAVLDKDSYETNEGMILVYGHTAGNAIESASRYRLTHGEAVSIGMVVAAKISRALGIAENDLVQKHLQILQALGLPTTMPQYIPRRKIFEFLQYDKKYTSHISSFILLSDIGQVYMKDGIVPQNVDPCLVSEIIQECYAS